MSGEGAVQGATDPQRRAIVAFRQVFGRAPSVIASAPGRVNLIGEHVDYADGIVLPMAIRERTAVAMRQARSNRSDIVSLELGARAHMGVPSTVACADRWVSAIVGPLRQLADAGIEVPPVEIVVASDVPIGAGVSSSAALASAVAGAALRLAGASMPPASLARLLQRAEERFLGTPCGIMDMMVALAAPGGSGTPGGSAMRLDCRSLEIDAVAIPGELELLLVDSGVRHDLASSGYAERRAQVEEAARRLGLPSLRDATPAQLGASALPPPLDRRARHVITEIERVDRMVAALRMGDLAQIGRIACEGHESLRRDFEVTVPEVDAIVDAVCTDMEGVLGARMVGGGFGGGVLVFAQRKRRVIKEMRLRWTTRVLGPGHGYTAETLEASTC